MKRDSNFLNIFYTRFHSIKMPLFFEEEQISGHNFKSSSELFRRFPKLKTKSCEFASQPTRSFQEEKILYVGQHEYGTVHPSDTSVTVIGSDSATTCQLVVLRHTGSGACSLAHFDGGQIEKALADMVKSLLVYSDSDHENRIELYVVGGFMDDRNLSEDIFLQILNGVVHLPATVELVCASVCALNDIIVNGKHAPKIYGIGVLVASGQVVPVQQYHCQIPDEALRHVALYAEQEEVRQVYSSITQELIVSPFQVYFPVHEARIRAALPDEVILKFFSTSPHCEPTSFVPKLREVFLFLAENPNIPDKFFPQRKPRKFKRKDNGDWYLIKES